MKRGLISKLNALLEPTPSADPEDLGNFDDGTRASSRGKGEAVDENDDDVAPSRLRRDRAMDSSEWGQRYASQKVSRNRLVEEEEDGLDDDDDDDEYDVDDGDEDDEVDDGDDDDDDDADEDGEDSNREVDEAMGGTDDEDGESDVVDDSDDGETSAFVGVGVDAALEALRREDRTDRAAPGPTEDQRERAARARALIAAYDSVLEVSLARRSGPDAVALSAASPRAIISSVAHRHQQT